MPTNSYDIFVSYGKADKQKVRLLVDILEGAGCTVFWDEKTPPGQDYLNVFESILSGCRFSIVCVSSAAIESQFVEAEIKKSKATIIPVWLERVDYPLIWEARLGRIQYVDLSRSRLITSDPHVMRICDVVTGRSPTAHTAGEQTLEARARELIERSSEADRSLAIALSVLGGATADEINHLAMDFEQRFRALVGSPARNGPVALESLSTRLQRIGAELFAKHDPRYSVTSDCARFVQPAFGHTLLALAWSDYHELRAPILDWISDWAAGSPLWIRLRLALNIGILAQDDRRFDVIWRQILRPMLFENTYRKGRAAKERFEVVDAALSIAALDASRRLTVEAILNEMIAVAEPGEAPSTTKHNAKFASLGSKPSAQENAASPASSGEEAQPAKPGMSEPAGNEPADPDEDGRENLASGGSEATRMYLVAKLAFGYTGSRFPDLAVKALRRLAEGAKISLLLRILGESYQERMTSARDDADGSLWGPVDLLDGLLRWAEDVQRERKSLPLCIFLLGLENLPLSSTTKGEFSLTKILQLGRGLSTIRNGFLLGLANPDTRDDFANRLRAWRDKQHEDPADPDPVLALFCALVYGAQTERDEARVRHIFRNHYSDDEVTALACQHPRLKGGGDGIRSN